MIVSLAHSGNSLTSGLTTARKKAGDAARDQRVKGRGCQPCWGIRTVAAGVVLQLVRVLRVSTLKPPSSGTRAKGWSHLEAAGELGAAVGDRERVGSSSKTHLSQRPPCLPLA